MEALWTGYKKKELESTLLGSQDLPPPTACLVLPTLDRGAKLFGGKVAYESGVASEFLPGVSSISGWFANGVVGGLDGTVAGRDGDGNDDMLHGSSAQYIVFRSKTRRQFYSPLKARIAAAREAESESVGRWQEKTPSVPPASDGSGAAAAPRSPDGELIVKRREIHAGRAMSVSTVEWSVAERTAQPTSALEGFMWEKETQVDRLRERVPLANLLSQTKLAMVDPQGMRPRDWVGAVKEAAREGGRFVIVPVSRTAKRRQHCQKKMFGIVCSTLHSLCYHSHGII